MIKVSETRSALRKMALTKVAAINLYNYMPDAMRGSLAYLRVVQPGNVLAASGLLGGAGLLRSAFTKQKEDSEGVSTLKVLSGLGLLGGGTALAINEDMRGKLSKSIFEAIGRNTR